MENENGKKLVSFTYPDGLRDAAKECFPNLPEDQATVNASTAYGK